MTDILKEACELGAHWTLTFLVRNYLSFVDV